MPRSACAAWFHFLFDRPDVGSDTFVFPFGLRTEGFFDVKATQDDNKKIIGKHL